MGPKITIGICTYNRAQSLKRLLDSITKLTYKKFDVIVVDNNSTDNTAEIVKKYKNIKYIFEKQQGIAFARNAVLQNCDDDLKYLAFLDDDESVEPDWLDRLLDIFVNAPKNVYVVGGRCIPVYFEKNAPAWIPDGIHNHHEFDLRCNAYVKESIIVSGNAMIDFQRVLRKNLTFDTRLGRKGATLLGGEELDFFSKLTEPDGLYGYDYRAYIKHYIPESKLKLSWFIRWAFYEGVTEYYREGNMAIVKYVHKVFTHSIMFILSIFSFNKKYICERLLKLIKTYGVMSGLFRTR